MTKSIDMASNWAAEIPIAITLTDSAGQIIYMNKSAQSVFSTLDGDSLVGSSIFKCHPGKSRRNLQNLYRNRIPNHYTITKKGQKKIIHQLPWFQQGTFVGYIELSIPIPENLPHFDRS